MNGPTVIWKFLLDTFSVESIHGDSVIRLDMPDGAKLLSVQEQFGRPALWAEVLPRERMRTYYIHVVGTGHPVSDNTGRFLGTVQFQGGGGLVLHFYEDKRDAR